MFWKEVWKNEVGLRWDFYWLKVKEGKCYEEVEGKLCIGIGNERCSCG
jgi:hypothetical protein